MKLMFIALVVFAVMFGLAAVAPTPRQAAHTDCTLPLSTFCQNLKPMEE